MGTLVEKRYISKAPPKTDRILFFPLLRFNRDHEKIHPNFHKHFRLFTRTISMIAHLKSSLFAILVSLVSAFFAVPSVLADRDFAVESLAKYDSEASAYTVPSSVNLVIVKKGSSDFVVWTRDELTSEDLTVVESYARAHDPSLKDRNAIFISGLGSQTIDTMYGTITFEDGTYGLTVTMPRKWSHLDYGRYTDGNPPPAPDPNPQPGKITLTKTVNGELWRVRCDYMDVEGYKTCDVRKISGCLWKRDWITNTNGVTSLEGHRNNKCGDAENWVIWADGDGVAYRMDEIKSGATGSTLPTVVYKTKAPMTDEEIANIGNPDRPECLAKYKQNFQETMPYSDIVIGERLYWITFNAGRIWYHSGVPYKADPQFVITVDGVEYVLTGGSSVEIEDLEPGIHDISESDNPLYSLGEVVSDAGGVIQADNGWTVQLYVEPGADMNVTWPNIQPDPKDPPSPPPPPHIDPEPDPEPDPDTPVVPTMCELLDFGKRFNAVIFGNLTISGGDSEGNLLVWGNASLPYGYSVGIPVVGESIPAAGPRDDAIIVAGDLLIGKQDVNGNIVYGGAYLGEDRTWNSYSVRHVAPVTLDRYGNVPADGSGRTAADLLAAVKQVSAYVADMEVNGSITNDVDGSLILIGTNETRNVFSVTAEEWSGSQRDWIFDVPAGSKVIVNVTGASVDIANGRMILASGLPLTPADVLVNYVDATLLTVSGFSHDGSVLAPFASGSFSGGAIQGIAIFGGDVVTKNGFEFHNFGLDVFFCPDRPNIVVTATAGSAADGDILAAELNAEVEVTVVVSNPSAFWLRSVTLTNSTGATILLGDIAPGGSVTNVQTITSAVEAFVTYTAWVSAKAYETAAATAVFESRPFVTASDIAVVSFAAGASAGAGGAAGTGTSGNPAAYNPTERVDYEVTDMWFSCVPTFAGEEFTVNVRVKNNGQVDGNGAFLGLYLVDVNHGATIESNEVDTAVRSIEMGGIPAKGSRVYSFSNLTAPDTNGTCRVIAFADMNGAEREWSKGDNQNNLTYELSQVAIHIDVSAEGVTLRWSNGWGQIYAILGSNDMEFWEPIEGHENILSARDTDGLVENTETIGFDETDYHFFKLRIIQR